MIFNTTSKTLSNNDQVRLTVIAEPIGRGGYAYGPETGTISFFDVFGLYGEEYGYWDTTPLIVLDDGYAYGYGYEYTETIRQSVDQLKIVIIASYAGTGTPPSTYDLNIYIRGNGKTNEYIKTITLTDGSGSIEFYVDIDKIQPFLQWLPLIDSYGQYAENINDSFFEILVEIPDTFEQFEQMKTTNTITSTVLISNIKAIGALYGWGAYNTFY